MLIKSRRKKTIILNTNFYVQLAIGNQSLFFNWLYCMQGWVVNGLQIQEFHVSSFPQRTVSKVRYAHSQNRNCEGLCLYIKEPECSLSCPVRDTRLPEQEKNFGSGCNPQMWSAALRNHSMTHL